MKGQIHPQGGRARIFASRCLRPQRHRARPGWRATRASRPSNRLRKKRTMRCSTSCHSGPTAKGVINKLRNRLYLFDSESGECKLLSPAFMNVADFDYHQPTDTVLYYGHDYEWMDDQKDDMYLRRLHGRGLHSGRSAAPLWGGRRCLCRGEGHHRGLDRRALRHQREPDLLHRRPARPAS